MRRWAASIVDETTRNAISTGLMALTDHAEQLDALRSKSSVPDRAVDEILRWSSPVSYVARRATRDTEIRGVRIAAGQRITPRIDEPADERQP